MDEIKRNLEVLGLKPGASVEEVKAAYRELAMVWHPDRFPADSPLQAKATAKLKELNSAYEYLMTHGFKDGVAIIPEAAEAETGFSPTPEESDPQETSKSVPGKSGTAVWILVVLLVCAGVAGWWVYHGRETSKSVTVVKTPPAEVAPPPSNAAVVPSNLNPPPAPAITPGLLPTMRPGGDQAVTNTSEGLVISRESWVHTREEYSPPFVVHAVAKTDLTNIRLVYSRGVVIFNWELNPSELRFHDPATGQITPVAGLGKVPVNEWQDIEWFVETNSSRIVVNGTERAHFTGTYGTLADPVAIGTARGGTVTVKQFEVRKAGGGAVKANLGPTAGLVLYFPFAADENGVLTDQSGFKNHGTVHGAKFAREGKVGGAMSFHGGKEGGEFISVPHSASLISMQRTRQMTICAWIKPNSLPDEYPVVLSKGGNYAPKSFGGYELILHARKDNDIIFSSGDSGLITEHARGFWVPNHLNEWIHVAVVVNAAVGSTKIYVNGERTGDDTTRGKDWHNANFAVANTLFIGGPDPAHAPNRAWFDGVIDEVRVYARALTAEEIRQLPGF